MFILDYIQSIFSPANVISDASTATNDSPLSTPSFFQQYVSNTPSSEGKAKIAYYFAYGSNMQRKRLEDRVGKVVFIGKARLEDYELDFSKKSKDGSGKANITEKVNSIVEGAIFQLSVDQLKMLDKFEGYPTHYLRQKIKVQRTKDDRIFSVHVYIAQSDHIQPNLRPTPTYLNYIIDGAKEIKATDTHEKLVLYKETLSSSKF